jgi:NitT/TauT family transport system ATP-binding protein
MLKFNQVSFKYGNNIILDTFTKSFPSNTINCIIGPSSAGKTTMLNIIANTLKPQQGKIEGLDKNVSYLFQDERLINEITVYKNLDFILKSVYPDSETRYKLIMNGLKSVDLQGTQDMFPSQLSGSMKRRLAMLRAFLYPSKVLLMDEPFTGLDINIKQQIIKLFITL